MTTDAPAPSPVAVVAMSLPRLAGYFLLLGATGFGGPIALAGRMQHDLVDRRRWFDRRDFLDGLALSQLAPGPLAAQLAMYLGFLQSGALGATVIGFAFVLPSFLMVWALAVAYVRFGGLPWIGAAFYGVGAAVMAVIALAAWKLARTTIGTKPLLWSIWIVVTIVTAVTQREILWLIVLAGIIPAAWSLRGRRLATRAASAPRTPLVVALAATPASSLFLFFLKAGVLVFGSGLAIVPFLYGEVVQRYHWLSDRQFLDAVAVAMIGSSCFSRPGGFGRSRPVPACASLWQASPRRRAARWRGRRSSSAVARSSINGRP